MIFLSALITGLQQSLIDQTLNTQPHITLRPADEVARPQLQDKDLLRSVQPAAQRVRSIPEWQELLKRAENRATVDGASPLAMGDAFARRGLAYRPVVLLGVDGERFDTVIPIKKSLSSGRYLLQGQDALIGTQLAEDLGVTVGDKIRIETPEDREALLLIVGIFDLGNQAVNSRWLITPLRTAQTLLDLPGGVNVLQLTVKDVFEAEKVAASLRGEMTLRVESWMQTNRQLLTALKSQSSSSYTIQFFIFLAVAMGIASVLIVSVVQRTAQIGILRAMGISRAAIFRIFLLQGATVGVMGSIVGAGVGSALSFTFSQSAVGPDGSATFPMALSWGLFLWTGAIAVATGIAAAAIPARRAARLDPVEAIRHG